jgi:hypothetical protein
MSGIPQNILDNLAQYKKKFYISRLIRGVLILLTIALASALFFSFLEYNFWFKSNIRLFIFLLYCGIILYLAFRYIFEPVYHLLTLHGPLSDEAAARQIGRHFPEVTDRLLNIIQLTSLQQGDRELIIRSIEQKSKEINLVPFRNAVDLSENRKYVKYLAIPVIGLAVVLIFIPQVLTESSTRIIRFDQNFEPLKPFQFELINTDLFAFRNEDYNLRVKINGNQIPDRVYVNIEGNRRLMTSESRNQFSYEFKNLQYSPSFSLEASGERTEQYTIDVVDRPKLREFQILLDYPVHTGLKRGRILQVFKFV